MIKQAAQELRFPPEILESAEVSKLSDKISLFFENIDSGRTPSKNRRRNNSSEDRMNKLAELILGDPDHGLTADRLTTGLEDFFRCQDHEAKRLYMEFMRNGLVKDLFIKILARIYSYPKPPATVAAP